MQPPEENHDAAENILRRHGLQSMYLQAWARGSLRGRAASQGMPRILLPLPPRRWDYKSAAVTGLLMAFLGIRSQAYSAGSSPTGPSAQPHRLYYLGAVQHQHGCLHLRHKSEGSQLVSSLGKENRRVCLGLRTNISAPDPTAVTSYPSARATTS